VPALIYSVPTASLYLRAQHDEYLIMCLRKESADDSHRAPS